MALRVEDIDLAADRQLVERWQSGDHAAFDDLYRRYYTRLRSFCQRRVGDRDTAEEIAQEAFVKALQALPTFAGELRFYPWVTVIASRLCVDHHRRQRRCQPSADINPGSVDGDHGVRLEHLADTDTLTRALRRLGPRHAEVLDLRERDGMSYAEIAAHLAVPQSTVETLLFRARKALRREFFAIAGDGRLATLPVLGAILRRLAGARHRVSQQMPSISQVSGSLAAGAMAAIIAAGPFAATASRAPTVSVGSQVAPVARTSLAASAPPADVPHDHASAPPAGLVSPNPATPAGIETMGSGAARDHASTMPVFIEVAGVAVGADPSRPQTWLPQLQED